MNRQRHFKQTKSFKDRIAAFADGLRRKLSDTAPGPERDAMREKLRQAEAAAHIDAWLNSPGLKPPKK